MTKAVDFETVIRRLETALGASLPGPAAQQRLAPSPRRDWPAGFDPARIRHAAGLLLVVPLDDRPHVVLTVRADTVGRHGGQVSLPGGVVEAGETFEQAALREASEEVGLAPDGVRTLGRLTPVDIPVSGFRLHPVVAASGSRPALRPSDDEVARILEVGIDELMDPGAFSWQTLTLDGRAYQVPALLVGGAEIWGATAMVLSEFLTMIGWEPVSD